MERRATCTSIFVINRIMPLHVFGGTLLFILSIVTALMGITEKNIFSGQYSELPKAAVLGNTLGKD